MEHISKKSKRSRGENAESSKSSKSKKPKLDLSAPARPKYRNMPLLDDDIEIDHSTGSRFDDLLMMLGRTQSSSSSQAKKSARKTVPSSSNENGCVQLTASVNRALQTLASHSSSSPILSLSPPWSSPSSSSSSSSSSCTAEVDVCFTSKNTRTKMYSGVKSGVVPPAPSVNDECIRFLRQNIDAIEHTGSIEYEVLRPILSCATAEQLTKVERHNPHIVVNTDELWEQLVKRQFRSAHRQARENWREMYARCGREKDARLLALTIRLKEKQTAMPTGRQVQLAYVDTVVKPPREVAKRQKMHCPKSNVITMVPASRQSAPVQAKSNGSKSSQNKPPMTKALKMVDCGYRR